MRVGILCVGLVVPDARTLKEKRRVVKSLKDRLHNTFNVSAAEVDSQDIHTRATLGIAVAGADGAYVQSVAEKVLSFIRKEAGCYIDDYELDVVRPPAAQRHAGQAMFCELSASALPYLAFDLRDLPWGAKIAFLVVAILSITLHEAGHALVADKVGDPTPRARGKVTLNPVPHIQTSPFMTLVLPVLTWIQSGGVWAIGAGACPVSPDLMRYPKKNLLVSAAGPAVNLILLLIAVGLMFLPFMKEQLSPSFMVLYLIARYEFILLVFNLFPMPPLDGAYILMSAVPSLKRPMLNLQQAGGMLIFIIAFFAAPHVIFPMWAHVWDGIGLLHAWAFS